MLIQEFYVHSFICYVHTLFFSYIMSYTYILLIVEDAQVDQFCGAYMAPKNGLTRNQIQTESCKFRSDSGVFCKNQ